MKKFFLLFLTVITFLVFVQGELKADKVNLAERYKKWLNEEVVYIILPLEKEVFLQLKTDRERDLFIEAFWKHRDPTPGTPDNEFRTEHYRRINYANHFFGRGTPKPGWRTDRGRVYIILGEPNDVEQFEGKTTVYPTAVWFYQGKTPLGLPPGFNLVFFQEGGIGEYRLYSPSKDGPQALLTSYWGDPADYLQAYEQLLNVEPILAEVSLSLIPGEGTTLGRPSLSSDLLIQKVESTPTREVEDRYAQKFLQYKDIVEVEYSANYIGNDSLVKVIKDPSGLYFVHYAIEPERLSVNQYENTYSTHLKLNGTVTDSKGRTIYQFEWDIPLRFDQEQMKNIMVRPFSIRDLFPLIPGEYNLSILVKNEVSKEFTSLERNLLIPQEEEEGLQMTSLMLGYSTSKKKASEQRLRPFQIGNDQISLQPNRVFLHQDNLVAAFQVHGLSEELKERSQLKFEFFKMGEEFRTLTRTFDQYPDFPNIMEKFSLQEFLPAHYRIQASILVDNQEVLFDSEEFDITHSKVIARPMVYQRLLAPSQDPIYSYVIGTQLFNSGKVEEAKSYLQEAFRKKPDTIEVALNLARVHMKLAEYGEIETVLLPFLNRLESPPYELLFIMGKAYQKMGKLDKAIEVFDKAISQYGLNMQLLNSIGECYFQLGKTPEALAAWEKSLEINPNQPQIKKYVDTIKKKK